MAEKKKFEPFKTRPIRMSDKTWKVLRQTKLESGKSWDKFIIDFLKHAINK